MLSYADAQYDLAVIGLNPRVGNVIGWLGTQSLGSDFYGVMADHHFRGIGLTVKSVFADAVYG